MRIKQKKGFTLVETMIGLVVLMILIAIAMSVIFVCFNVFGKNANLDNAQLVGNGIYDYIENNLRCATKIYVGTTEPQSEDENYGEIEPNKIILSQGGGKVCFMTEENAIFDEDYMKGVKVRVDISADTEYPNLVSLSVIVFDENESLNSNTSLYQKSGSFALLNFDGSDIGAGGSNVNKTLYLAYLSL